MNHAETHNTLKETITEADHPGIQALLAACEQHDGQSISINVETLSSEPGNGLLYYQNNQLVAVVSIFSMDTLEATGTVHPTYRRQGIASTLLSTLKTYCREQHKQELTLICSGSLPSGEAFANAVGAKYTFSEYHMKLSSPSSKQPAIWHGNLTLRQAKPEEASLVTHAITQSFDDDSDYIGPWVSEAILKPARRFFLVSLDEQLIGVISATHEGAQNVDITTFAILPAFRGHGYGRQVLWQMVDTLRAEGWQEIGLDVETENSNALSLYQSCGFQQTHVYKYYRLPL